VYQWLLERVKPERDANRDAASKKVWWLHGRTRSEIRPALANLPRYIATVETAKHRTFQFLDASILPDNKLIAIALAEPFHLGVLSSSAHTSWALAAGSWLGVGNDPVYVKSRCFETFPFPDNDTGLTPELRARIASLAEQIDHHRKKVLGLLPSNSNHAQAPTKNLTLTGLYNVLEALREGRSLTAKEKQIHSQGLVGVLKDLHDDLDAAVLQAYGWTDRPDAQELLVRLVALNARRTAEEKTGTVRWLRPEFQNPGVTAAGDVPSNQALASTPSGQQADLVLDAAAAKLVKAQKAAPTGNGIEPQAWPATLPDQVRAVAAVLTSAPVALSLEAIEARFKSRGAWKKSLPRILDTLEALGRARREADGWRG
jgi:hypothetical protein